MKERASSPGALEARPCCAADSRKSGALVPIRHVVYQKCPEPSSGCRRLQGCSREREASCARVLIARVLIARGDPPTPGPDPGGAGSSYYTRVYIHIVRTRRSPRAVCPCPLRSMLALQQLSRTTRPSSSTRRRMKRSAITMRQAPPRGQRLPTFFSGLAVCSCRLGKDPSLLTACGW